MATIYKGTSERPPYLECFGDRSEGYVKLALAGLQKSGPEGVLRCGQMRFEWVNTRCLAVRGHKCTGGVAEGLAD